MDTNVKNTNGTDASADTDTPKPQLMDVLAAFVRKTVDPVVNDLEARLHDELDERVSAAVDDVDIDDKIEAWMDHNFDITDQVEDAVSNVDIDDKIENWVDYNLDISDKVSDALGDVDFSDYIDHDEVASRVVDQIDLDDIASRVEVGDVENEEIQKLRAEVEELKKNQPGVPNRDDLKAVVREVLTEWFTDLLK